MIAKTPPCDRSLLALCSLRLCGSLKKRSPKLHSAIATLSHTKNQSTYPSSVTFRVF
ncbi:hypothetical protein [Nostoc sp. WHI]|uniref:hypothetical protein n=1 Tax=Nostoc sp. WHI TaxID=2650611 RepID=UPI0018C45972|nr:hypothetical protein [Nostoc sp. WHI]